MYEVSYRLSGENGLSRFAVVAASNSVAAVKAIAKQHNVDAKRLQDVHPVHCPEGTVIFTRGQT